MASVNENLQFSKLAYQGPDGDYTDVPQGWEMVAQSDPNSDGYFGAAFENKQTGEIVVANRGSRADKAGLKEDWLGSDPKIAAQGGLGLPAAFDRSTEFAQQVKTKYPDRPISFTGHSLGGAEAQVQAAQIPGSTGMTFGAPGAAFAVDSETAKSASHSVVNFVLPGDLIGGRGDHIGQVKMLVPSGTTALKDIAAVIVAFAIGGLLGLLALAIGFIAANHPLGNYEAALAQQSQPGGGKPAARLTDMHTCPAVTGVVPHVGGPISGPCAPTVLIGGLPAARISDFLVCVGPPDMIVTASATVFICGQPAARIGDNTAHGGVIVAGLPTVLIG